MRAAVVLALALSWLGSGSVLADDGDALYQAVCASCHGATGRGDTPAGRAMNLRPLEAMSGEALTGYIRGNARHKALSDKLSDEELRAIAKAIPTGD